MSSDSGEHELTSEDKRILKYLADAARDEMPSRRGFAQGASAALGIGALGFGTGQATAQTQPAAGQVGTENNPVDVEAATVNAGEVNKTPYADAAGEIQSKLDGAATGTDDFSIVSLEPDTIYQISSKITVNRRQVLDLNGATVEITADVDGIFLDAGARLLGPGFINVSNGTYTSRAVYVDSGEAGTQYNSNQSDEAIISGYPRIRGAADSGVGFSITSDGDGGGGVSLGNVFEIDVTNFRDGVELVTKNDGVTNQSFINGPHIYGSVQNSQRYQFRHHDDGNGSDGPAGVTFMGDTQPDVNTTTALAVNETSANNSIYIISYDGDAPAGYTDPTIQGDGIVLRETTTRSFDQSEVDGASVIVTHGTGSVNFTGTSGTIEFNTFEGSVTLPAVSSESSFTSAGDIAMADGTNWDPDGDGNAEIVIRNAADNGWVEIADLGGAL